MGVPRVSVVIPMSATSDHPRIIAELLGQLLRQFDCWREVPNDDAGFGATNSFHFFHGNTAFPNTSGADYYSSLTQL